MWGRINAANTAAACAYRRSAVGQRYLLGYWHQLELSAKLDCARLCFSANDGCADHCGPDPPAADNPDYRVAICYACSLKLSKEATLSDIATQVSGQSQTTTQLALRKSQFAGLDATEIDLQDTQNKLIETVIAFRLPDGRVGWLLGLGPEDTWADFAPSFDGIRTSAKLLKPTAYNLPTVNKSTTFAPGGLTFICLPSGPRKLSPAA